MLNKQAIYQALVKQPLCHGALIRQVGMTHEVCAVGALILDVGGSVEDLRENTENGLFKKFRIQLLNKFGIESYDQLSKFVQVNDSEEYATRRTKKVLEIVVGLTDEDINTILGKVDVVNETVSTESIQG